MGESSPPVEYLREESHPSSVSLETSPPRIDYCRQHDISTMVESPMVESYVAQFPVLQSNMVESPIEEGPMVQSPRIQSSVVQSSMIQSPVMQSPVFQSPVMQSPVIQSPVLETPVIQSPMADAWMMMCVTPPHMSRLEPMCVTPQIQVPTNTPTIPGLINTTKGAQSLLLKEAASKLETDTNTHMGMETHLEAVQERVIPDGNNTLLEVMDRNYKLNTKAKRGRVEVETEDGGLTIDMEEAV